MPFMLMMACATHRKKFCGTSTPDADHITGGTRIDPKRHSSSGCTSLEGYLGAGKSSGRYEIFER